MILGLMGTFASGKSTAAQYFVERGFIELDVDSIGKDALKHLRQEITAEFGSEILEGEDIAPAKLGNLVFLDEGAMGRLNALVHPWIKNQVKQRLQSLPGKDVLVNAAILPQIGLVEFCHRILLVEADESILIQRGMERNGFSAPKVKKILDLQKRGNAYREIADDVIVNEGSVEEFYRNLDVYWKSLR